MKSSRISALLCLLALCFAGCFPKLGYRPEFPTTLTPIPACEDLADASKACTEYYNIATWRAQLTQAYKTKALINEWSVYMAGAVGIIGGAVVGTLTATNQGNTDAAKVTPPITGAIVALLALNQSDDKANAYDESTIALEEAQAATDRYVSRNKTKEGFQLGSYILKDSIQQEIINLDSRMVAIRKKMAASIPKTTASSPQAFTKATAGKPLDVNIFTKNLEADLGSVTVTTAPFIDAIPIEVKDNRVTVRLDSPKCQDYMLMLSIGNTLVLPPRNLRCE